MFAPERVPGAKSLGTVPIGTAESSSCLLVSIADSYQPDGSR